MPKRTPKPPVKDRPRSTALGLIALVTVLAGLLVSLLVPDSVVQYAGVDPGRFRVTATGMAFLAIAALLVVNLYLRTTKSFLWTLPPTFMMGLLALTSQGRWLAGSAAKVWFRSTGDGVAGQADIKFDPIPALGGADAFMYFTFVAGCLIAAWMLMQHDKRNDA